MLLPSSIGFIWMTIYIYRCYCPILLVSFKCPLIYRCYCPALLASLECPLYVSVLLSSIDYKWPHTRRQPRTQARTWSFLLIILDVHVHLWSVLCCSSVVNVKTYICIDKWLILCGCSYDDFLVSYIYICIAYTCIFVLMSLLLSTFICGCVLPLLLPILACVHLSATVNIY